MTIAPMLMGIGSVLSGVSSVGSAIGNYFSQSDTNKLNEKLYREQVEYNKPINQMTRLQEAGLNPALMYGKGPGANIASAPPSMTAPPVDKVDLLGPMASYQQIMNMDAQLAGQLEQNKILAETAKQSSIKTKMDKRDFEILTGLEAETGVPLQKDDNKIMTGTLKVLHGIPRFIDRAKTEAAEDWQEYREKVSKNSSKYKRLF